MAMVVGKAGVELDTRRSSVRTAETNMGNLIADAIRVAVKADVGLTNGGGIRGDKTYPAGTELTRKDILTELPFGNVTVLLEVSGVLTFARPWRTVSPRSRTRPAGFPQISGMSFVYDPKAPVGKPGGRGDGRRQAARSRRDLQAAPPTTTWRRAAMVMPRLRTGSC